MPDGTQHMELTKPTTAATQKGKRRNKLPNSRKTAEKPRGAAEPAEMNARREERGKDLM